MFEPIFLVMNNFKQQETEQPRTLGVHICSLNCQLSSSASSTGSLRHSGALTATKKILLWDRKKNRVLMMPDVSTKMCAYFIERKRDIST